MNASRLEDWLLGLAIAAGGWALGWLLRLTVLPPIARLAGRSRTQVDDVLLTTLRPHVPVWFLLLGVVVGARVAPVDAVVRGRIDRGAEALLILSLSLALASFLTRLLDRSAERWAGTPGGTSLVQNVVRFGVLGLGVLVILSNLGVAVTPVLTALGLGSLAIALGLQPTLTNLFAGFHITMARQVRVGDHIELDNGMQGVVEDIGWRVTLIREPANNQVVVPNARLAEMVLRNYTRPDPEMGFVVTVGVAYGADLARVEAVTLEAARRAQRDTEGAVAAFEPLVRFASFGESAVQMNVVLRARAAGERFLLTSEFLRLLHASWHDAGIPVPLPQRVVHTVVERGGPPSGGDAPAE